VRSYEPCLVSENGSVHPISQKAKSISFWTNIGYEVDSAQWIFSYMGVRLVVVSNYEEIREKAVFEIHVGFVIGCALREYDPHSPSQVRRFR
jgi:hypothetical protein